MVKHRRNFSAHSEGRVPRRVSVTPLGPVVIAIALAATLSGCSGGGGPGGGSLPMGESCTSIRGKINRLDAKGVPSLVEAQSRGKKLAGQQKADADAYNNLLNQYLGARCHEAPKT
jgi:hypothetical protein